MHLSGCLQQCSIPLNLQTCQQASGHQHFGLCQKTMIGNAWKQQYVLHFTQNGTEFKWQWIVLMTFHCLHNEFQLYLNLHKCSYRFNLWCTCHSWKFCTNLTSMTFHCDNGNKTKWSPYNSTNDFLKSVKLSMPFLHLLSFQSKYDFSKTRKK